LLVEKAKINKWKSRIFHSKIFTINLKKDFEKKIRRTIDENREIISFYTDKIFIIVKHFNKLNRKNQNVRNRISKIETEIKL
jgi:hypothetical protein